MLKLLSIRASSIAFALRFAIRWLGLVADVMVDNLDALYCPGGDGHAHAKAPHDDRLGFHLHSDPC